MHYQLYGGRYTRAMIVQMVLAEAGIDYELHEIDILENEHQDAEFLRLNPAGYVPVLVTPEGEVLSETPAINLYLAERYNVGELAPSIGEAERGPFLSRLFFLSGDLEPILKRMFYPERFVLRPGDEAEMSEKSLREALQRMQLIERDLEHRGPYQLGPRFSLLDIILSFWVEYVNVDGALETCPALLRCYQLVRERPRIRPCFEQMIEQRAEYARLRQTSAGAD